MLRSVERVPMEDSGDGFIDVADARALNLIPLTVWLHADEMQAKEYVIECPRIMSTDLNDLICKAITRSIASMPLEITSSVWKKRTGGITRPSP
jgi:hypothetical protein